MKKIILIILAVIISLVAVLIVIGPSDPIVLTKEQEVTQKKETTKKFSNLNISGFKTKNLYGKKINSDIFKNNKITMVNIFTTWCNPCIEEMPDIAKLYNDLPKNSNVIGICVDAGDDEKTLKLAQKIMQESHANFTVLVPDEVLNKKLLNLVTMYPTTIFIDSEGKIVGDVYAGGHSAKEYKEALVKRLAIVQAKK